ncbi:ABC transporter substrate-binding protein [Kribbella deserti]|uniref:ABC transporter substrate-binding protein n=1 Tax=Kribbella deserti TaxID=1926257 RepID=A0ABV6QMX7_9ACTN
MAHAKRVGSAIAAGLALTLTLAACGGGNDNTGGGGNTGGEGFKGGTMTVYLVDDVEHLDPVRNFVTNSNAIGKLLTRTLTEFKYDGKTKKTELVPDLAEKWESNDGLDEWKFTLKDGLKYEDGTPVKAADIKYNVERGFSPDLSEGSPYPKEMIACQKGYVGPYSPAGNNGGKGCEAITTPDDKTIVFKLQRPVAEFDMVASMKNFSPVPQDKDTKTQYDARPVSTGPYKIQTYTRKKELVLVRNDQWDQKSDTLRNARPDKFVFKFGDDEAVVDQRLIANGTADASSFSFSGVQPQNLPKTNSANVKDRVIEGADQCRRYIAFNQQKPLLKNQKLREALYYGLDRVAYQTARGGERLAAIVDSVVPEDMKGYEADTIFQAPPAGDKAKAKALLTEAGYKGEKLTLGTADSGLAVKAAESAQQAWKAIGINVDIRKIPGDNYYSTQQNDASASDLITAGWCPDYPSIASVVAPVLGPDTTSATPKAAQNNYGRSLVGFDKFKAVQLVKDKDQAVKDWSALYKEIMQTAPLVPTVKDLNVYVLGGNIDSAFPDPNTGGIPDLTQIGLKKAS